MYRQHLFENLNFSLFGQAAEQGGFLDKTECKRLLKLWQEDKDKAVSTFVEATEAKGPAGFGMFLSTLQGTLDVEGIDTTTREQHQVLLHELSQVEPCEPTEMVSNTIHLSTTCIDGVYCIYCMRLGAVYIRTITTGGDLHPAY